MVPRHHHCTVLTTNLDMLVCMVSLLHFLLVVLMTRRTLKCQETLCNIRSKIPSTINHFANHPNSTPLYCNICVVVLYFFATHGKIALINAREPRLSLDINEIKAHEHCFTFVSAMAYQFWACEVGMIWRKLKAACKIYCKSLH